VPGETPNDGFRTELARELAADALERFLRYVRIDTQADPHSTTYPSTAKQLNLSRLLVDELRELGLDADLDEHGYVMATVPATVSGDVPAVGFIAHVDVSPAAPAADVKPQVVRYDGAEISLPGDPSVVIAEAVEPELAEHLGHDLVTSDGTTLLGADDKGGVAEIMAAAAYLARHPEIPHGPVRIGFTPDEEIGAGTVHFDLERFGAAAAYTLDGSGAGEIEDETFSALQARLEFRGVSVHTGTAKGRLVSAARVAADFLTRLPRDLSPEETEDREGFVHPEEVSGHTEQATVTLILRDHDEEKLAGHEALVRRLAHDAVAAWPGSRVEITVRRQYRNMKQYLSGHPHVVEIAEEAIRRAGIEPQRTIIRGGTDGSRLSEMGLPTPNLFTGGHAYHSRSEWICVQDMGSAAETVVHLVQIWAERSGASRAAYAASSSSRVTSSPSSASRSSVSPTTRS
jgi:tripeptide aminopeptidase